MFVGEKIIEVRRVGPPQDVWYKLGEEWVNEPLAVRWSIHVCKDC